MHAQTAHHLQRHDQNRNPLEPCRPKPNHLTKQTVAAQLPVGSRAPAGSGEPGAAGPGLGYWGRTRHGPLTIDLDSTICETYGLAKEGARHPSYAGQRGYHLLLAIAAGTGDVLMSRLREGRANTVRGAAHFLRETVGRVRYAGARGQLTVRADSGFYTHALVAVCRAMDVRFSITISPSPSASTPACVISLRQYPRRTGRPSLLDGRRRRCGRDHLHPLPE